MGQVHIGELLGAAHGAQLNENRVHHAVDGGVRSDAKRQHRHYCESESRRLAQLAQREA